MIAERIDKAYEEKQKAFYTEAKKYLDTFLGQLIEEENFTGRRLFQVQTEKNQFQKKLSKPIFSGSDE
ncbi:hypothetical protein MFLO_10024 [Listeria floridensis FSL S10-1187]|uniref:Uncharacterized protein n=1 Tax=Listeria floridensis FSL S10-1187 TaxID=1265817 RepID=A0ABP3AY39_9LIST|nr:hypothetical protein [Listeria floridensis]EUJ30731.1 hypothetical protein MFLO_10024 [Listeria floridensis FSL S10-1187]